jgi:hypothetical protein
LNRKFVTGLAIAVSRGMPSREAGKETIRGFSGRMYQKRDQHAAFGRLIMSSAKHHRRHDEVGRIGFWRDALLHDPKRE